MKPRFPPRLQAGGSALRAHGNKPKIHIIVYFLFSPHLQKMGSDIRERGHTLAALSLWATNAIDWHSGGVRQSEYEAVMLGRC